MTIPANALPLRRGSQGDAVRALQARLRELGYPVEADGFFGGETDTAVETFQRSRGLAVDGVVGTATARALNVAVAPVVDLTPAQPSAGKPLWLVKALSLVGTKEAPGAANNRRIMGWAEDLGGYIKRVFTADSIPWCALFANYVLESTGYKGFGTLWALDVVKWGRNLGGPAVGALVGMSRNGGGHVAIVVGRTAGGDLVCVGGNQSDNVTVARFARARVNPVNGYRWPNEAPLPAKIGFEHLPIVAVTGARSTNER